MAGPQQLLKNDSCYININFLSYFLFFFLWFILDGNLSKMLPILVIQWSYLCYALCLVAQSWQILCNPMDCNPPGSSIQGDSPGKNTGVGYHVLLQGTFPIQGLNLSLLCCRYILYHRKEWSFATCNTLDRLKEYYAKWNKSYRERNTLCNYL